MEKAKASCTNGLFLQVCIATHNGCETQAYSLRLSKGARNRVDEDTVASRLLVKALAEGCGLGKHIQALDLNLKPEDSHALPSSATTEVVQVYGSSQSLRHSNTTCSK